MTYCILMNPLSRNGQSHRVLKKLQKRLLKNNDQFYVVSLLEIADIQAFVETLDAAIKIIVVGGDGTLNRMVNRIKMLDIKHDMYLYQAGTGNDFARSVPKKNRMIHLNPYLKGLPEVRHHDEFSLFLNCAGIGLDGLVCEYMARSEGKKSKLNYFKETLRAFKNYKPIAMTFTIDGISFEKKKVWLASVMNAPYLGGGMKMAPKQLRSDDDLTLVVIEKVPKWLVFLIFPTIYLGWHRIFKSFVSFYKGKHIKIELQHPEPLQIDGDYAVSKEIEVRKE